jgi:hypothetical protein
MVRCAILIFSLVTVYCSLVTAVAAQTRDYFTDPEIELIRDAQQIDKRIDVLTKTIDRRFAVLKINAGGSAPEGKDWGALPTGTRVELLSDIRNILQKAIDDIDNLSARPDSMVIDPEAAKDKKKQKGFSDLFPKAVKSLAAAARRYEPALKQSLDTAKDEHEKGLIADSLDLCDEIIAAEPKLK